MQTLQRGKSYLLVLENLLPVRFGCLGHLTLTLKFEAAELLRCMHSGSCLYGFVGFPHGGKISNYRQQSVFRVNGDQPANTAL